MKIGSTEIKEGRTYVVADVGSNFNGSLELAKEYIHAAKEIGVDAIKFQTYRVETLMNPLRPNGEPWEAMESLRKYELPMQWHYELFACAEEVGIEFITTPFDLDLLDELNSVGVRAFKVASGDLTFYPLLRKIASFGKPVILSTGMAYLHEIREALQVLQDDGAQDIALLHCVGQYPPSYASMNLRAIETMRSSFGLPVGLSDHTPDDAAVLAALALGSCIVEKHITMDGNLGTPDASFAMTVNAFAAMVEKIRNCEAALGNGVKSPAIEEAASRTWGRRGIYAKKNIRAGEILSLENVKFVRPASGLGPSVWSQYAGATSKKPIQEHAPISASDLEAQDHAQNNGHSRSSVWLARAERVVPGCAQTFSKAPGQYVQGLSPYAVEAGEGPYLLDVDGKRFLDYPMALGAVILGYNYPDVNKAVIRQLHKGVSFSLPHPLEILLAEKLTSIIPCAEMVRFGKNGSDVTAGAVRLARAVTGRERVACCGYHGWQDWYIGSTAMCRGVPEAVRALTHTFTYNDGASLESLLDSYPGQFAAIVMEPAGQVPHPGFLERVRGLADKHGTVLVFDEIVSGFRLHLGGAQALYNVVPDLACFGKGMANGFPISALVGKRELMKELAHVFFSFTFGGECLSIVAALETIRILEEYRVMDHIHEYGLKLMEACRDMIRRHGLEKYVSVIAHPQNMALSFKEASDDEQILKSLFQQEVISRGILFNGNHATTFSHTVSEFEKTIRAYDEALSVLAAALESSSPERFLKCEPLRPIFAVRSHR
ncbi:MAG TPA: aminotransferase class III-fold pyridoxal phosphate-dependent enzyme [Syntrophorhabdales bacterium]|nr:aminotransferase class III-fold pyridoxal phosphate-dependent enzyme [Syntrophorhabdales bacterium]